MIDEENDDRPLCADCGEPTEYEDKHGDPCCVKCEELRNKPPVADGHFDGENPYDERGMAFQGVQMPGGRLDNRLGPM